MFKKLKTLWALGGLDIHQIEIEDKKYIRFKTKQATIVEPDIIESLQEELKQENV